MGSAVTLTRGIRRRRCFGRLCVCVHVRACVYMCFKVIEGFWLWKPDKPNHRHNHAPAISPTDIMIQHSCQMSARQHPLYVCCMCMHCISYRLLYLSIFVRHRCVFIHTRVYAQMCTVMSFFFFFKFIVHLCRRCAPPFMVVCVRVWEDRLTKPVHLHLQTRGKNRDGGGQRKGRIRVPCVSLAWLDSARIKFYAKNKQQETAWPTPSVVFTLHSPSLPRSFLPSLPHFRHFTSFQSFVASSYLHSHFSKETWHNQQITPQITLLCE